MFKSVFFELGREVVTPESMEQWSQVENLHWK